MATNELEAWTGAWSSSDSDDSGSTFSDDSSSSLRMEAVRVASESLLLPQGLCDKHDVFKELLSAETWQTFSEHQKHHLKKFLPTFLENDEKEKETTLQMLFARENFKFGNPLTEFYNHLKAAHYRPDMSRMRSLLKKAQLKDYKRLEKWRMYELVKSVLVSRQRLVDAVVNGEKAKVSPLPPKRPKMSNSHNVKSRYFQELALIREEVGESSQSSEDECFPEGPLVNLNKKQKKSVNLVEVFNDGIPPVLGTLSVTGLVPDQGKTVQNNPYAVSEQSYAQMLNLHSKRRASREVNDHPDLLIDGITLQDVSSRCKTLKKSNVNKSSVPRKVKMKAARTSSVISPVIEEEAEDGGSENDEVSALMNSIKREAEEESEKVDIEGIDDLPTIPIVLRTNINNNSQSVSPKTNRKDSLIGKKIKLEPTEPLPVKKANEFESRKNKLEIPELTNQNVAEVVDVQPKKIKVEPTSSVQSSSLDIAPKNVKVEMVEPPVKSVKVEQVPPPAVHTPPVFSISSLKPTTNAISRVLTPATLSDLDGIDMMDLPVDFDESSPLPLEDIKPHPELMQETHACFFSLIRDILTSTPDHRIEMKELELRVKLWASSPIGPINHWYTPHLESQLHCAVQFLAGNLPEIAPDDYVPYMEWKAAVGAYQWIGAGRDSDHRLVVLCTLWLERGADRGAPTGFVTVTVKEVNETVVHTPRGPAVQPTLPKDREIFQQQEKQRYETPYRAFTYSVGGVETAVGPVRSIQTANSAKARGHTLLVENRPKHVTILELVRDAVSRLPNAQGTRADIVTLLKDSQYLSETAAESMLSSVVSGALDRLHCEPDPSVKYDARRKIWVNLHKGRSPEEFERLHALGADVKVSRPKACRKSNKAKKEQPAKVDVRENSTDQSAEIEESSNVLTITSSTSQELTMPIVTQSKPKLLQKTVTVPSVTKKIISESVKSLIGKGKNKANEITTSQQQIIRLQQNQLNQGIISTLKRPAELQKAGASVLPTRAVIHDTSTLVKSPQQNIKKVQTQAVTLAADHIPKQAGKSIVKVITSQGAVHDTAVRTVQRVPQMSQQHTQQVIQIKQPIVPDQKQVQKGQLKKTLNPGGQQQLIVMKQASGDQSSSGQQQMILINQQQIVMDSQQLTISIKKSQKQFQQLLNKQQMETGNNSPVQQQQLQQLLIAKQHQMVVEQQKSNKPQQQMIVVKQQGSAVTANDGTKQPMQQMILVKQTGGDGDGTTTQITQQQLQQMILLKQQHHQQQQHHQPQQQHRQQQQQSQQIIMVKQPDQKSVQVITQPAQKNQTQHVTLAQLQQLQQQQRNSSNNTYLGHPRVVAHVSGQTVAAGSTSLIKPQNQGAGTPVVAKVVTSQTPVLTMDNLLAHHKQQSTATQQAGVRLPTVCRSGISSQYVVSLPQSRVVQTSVAQVATSSSGGANVVAVSSLGDSGTYTKLASGQGVRIPGLNLAQITGGKQVFLASKPQNSTSVQGQNVLLSNSGSQALLVGGSQQGTVAVLQQGSQQILIPPGALKTLQGLKVIPITQGKPQSQQGRQQVFARIINPSAVRQPVITANVVHPDSSTSLQTLSSSSAKE